MAFSMLISIIYPFSKKFKITSSLVEVLSLSLGFQQLDCSVDLYDVLGSVSREENRGWFVMSSVTNFIFYFLTASSQSIFSHLLPPSILQLTNDLCLMILNYFLGHF